MSVCRGINDSPTTQDRKYTQACLFLQEAQSSLPERKAALSLSVPSQIAGLKLLLQSN